MASPNTPAANECEAPNLSVVEVSNQLKSTSDTISQLSQSSAGLETSFSSPVKRHDCGVLRTPEVRVIAPTNEVANDLGYDSDGLQGPWEGCKELNFDDLDELGEALPIVPPPVSPEESCQENVAEKKTTVDDARKMNVAQLRDALKKRGLTKSGNKSQLLSRLIDAIEKGAPLVERMSSNDATNLAGDVFSPGSHWEYLECDGEFVNESIPNGFRAPTVPLGETSSVRKRNYSKNSTGWFSLGNVNCPSVTGTMQLREQEMAK